ncbi:MAG: phage portal protein [Bacteroidales bacterium]|nr:phage portal protein [Bacteroidales bacterium]
MSIFSRKKEVIPQISEEEKRANDFACCSGGEFRISKVPGKRGALSISTVFACVELISNSIAMMDINVKSKETKTRLTQIALQKVFEKNKLTKFNLIKNMVSDMLLYGNGYAKIERATDGTVVGLSYLPASEVSAFFNDNVSDTYFMFRGERLLPAELIHIFKNTYNGYIGVPIITFAARALQLANAAEDSAVDYYSSGLNINAILHAT